MPNVLVIPSQGAPGALGVPYGTLADYLGMQDNYTQFSDIVIPDPPGPGPVPAYIPFPTNIPYAPVPAPNIDGCSGFCFIVWIDRFGNFFRGESGPCPPIAAFSDAQGGHLTIDEWALAVINQQPVGSLGGLICLDQFGDVEQGFGGECPPGTAPPIGFLIYCETNDLIIGGGPGTTFVEWVPATIKAPPPKKYPVPCPCLVNKVVV